MHRIDDATAIADLYIENVLSRILAQFCGAHASVISSHAETDFDGNSRLINMGIDLWRHNVWILCLLKAG